MVLVCMTEFQIVLQRQSWKLCVLGRPISLRAGEGYRCNHSSMNFNSVCNALTQDKPKFSCDVP